MMIRFRLLLSIYRVMRRLKLASPHIFIYDRKTRHISMMRDPRK